MLQNNLKVFVETCQIIVAEKKFEYSSYLHVLYKFRNFLTLRHFSNGLQVFEVGFID